MVMHEMASALIPEIDTVNSLKSGMALKLPSEKERERVVGNLKFSEHRLEELQLKLIR